MWLKRILYFLTTVEVGKISAIGHTDDDIGMKNSPLITEEAEVKFRELLTKELHSLKKNQSLKKFDERLVETVTLIENHDLVILRDVKFAEYLDLEITFLNPNLDVFSTRVNIEAGDFVFFGKIHVNDDPKVVGEIRYEIKNLTGSGLFGLDVSKNGNFVFTNYFVDYYEDDTKLETDWLEKKFKFPEKRLKAEIYELIDSTLTTRLDLALKNILKTDVFGSRASDIFETRRKFEDFYDKVFDELIIELNEQLQCKNKTEIPLTDIDSPFTYNIGLINLHGQFLASEGWLGNLATFVRRGSISLGFESGNFIVFGSLGLSDLRLGYGFCSVKIGGVGPSGKISGKIGKNVAQFAISISAGNRSINLTNFKITELSDVEVKLTGLGIFDWLASKIAGLILNLMESDVIPIVEPIIKVEIDQLLSNLDFNEVIKSAQFFDHVKYKN